MGWKPDVNPYALCACGSGKKYKWCCLNKDREAAHRRPPAQSFSHGDEQPRCGLCGKTGRLTKTECCGRWICDDEDQYVIFSYVRNSCHRNHRRYTLCGFHHAEGHEGRWQDCRECLESFEAEMYVDAGTNEYNFEKLPNPPAYKPTSCVKCGKVIKLSEGGYSTSGDGYLCGDCAEREFGLAFN